MAATGRPPGRPPKPDNLKRIEGNPGKRRLRVVGPDAGPPRATARKRPTMPRNLSDGAKREWRRIVPILDARGLIDAADVRVLATYCEAVAVHEAAAAIVAAKGVLVVGHRGAAARNPALMVMRQAAADIRAASALFGLTPSDRARPLDAAGVPGSDMLAALLAAD